MTMTQQSKHCKILEWQREAFKNWEYVESLTVFYLLTKMFTLLKWVTNCLQEHVVTLY